MSPILYFAISCLIAVFLWFVLNAAWGKDMNPFVILLITIALTLIWPLALLGVLVIGLLILINKPRKPS
jgi:hypothetical protein